MRAIYLSALFLLLSCCLCFSGCSEDTDVLDEGDDQEEIYEDYDIVDDGPVDVNRASAKLVSANTDFGFKLFSELVEQDIGENIFMSPISIEIALAMTHNGAAGETQRAMAEALSLRGLNLNEVNHANAAMLSALGNLDMDVELEIANSLWANQEVEFKPDFIKRNEDFYGAEVANLDFGDPAVPGIINGWISEKTHGKIDNMIDKVGPNIILFLVNALYFKGTWTIQFDKEKTREQDFALLDGSEKKVQMMTSESDYMSYWGEGFQAVSLPYGDGRVSMYLFLPDPNSSLPEFYKKLNAASWEGWTSKFYQNELRVYLPRFKLEYKVKLNDALSSLGMGVAFGNGADFGRMCPTPAFISEVNHKAFVEVNEEGTEAAAATVVEIAKLGGGPIAIVFDRPFFCAIRDNETGALLFMGSVVDP
ncbi:serpin family protein [Candidatus Poribacteria bacterium]